MKSERMTLIAGLSLLVPAVLWLFSKNDPTVLYPFPGLVVVPALFGLGIAAVVVPVLTFFVWNPGLFQGNSSIPKRSYLLLATATLLSVLWFVIGWKDGMDFQGKKYGYSVLTINGGWLTLLWLMFVHNRKSKKSFHANLLLHWILFVWLAWYAFPFFGELP